MLRASFGMMILIARVYFYVPCSFIHRKLRTSCLCKRKEKNNSFLNINVVSLSKKNRLRKSGLSEKKKIKNRFLFFLNQEANLNKHRQKILRKMVHIRFDRLFFAQKISPRASLSVIDFVAISSSYHSRFFP